MKEQLKKTHAAQIKFRQYSEEQRGAILRKLAEAMDLNQERLIAANRVDIAEGQNQGLPGALLDRLVFQEKQIAAAVKSLHDIAAAKEVVGVVEENYKRPNGLEIHRVRVPLGVILMIFESRPNVIPEGAGLCLKSGNALVLKGGKEALQTNTVLGQVIAQTLVQFDQELEGLILVLPSDKKELIDELLKMNDLIDLVIPRGREELIQKIRRESSIPVIAHAKGNCHLYVHEDANLEMALNLIMNAKLSRPGVCNALETLVVHEKVAKVLMAKLINKAQGHLELRLDMKLQKDFPQYAVATTVDWETEYLDKILAVKMVQNAEEAFLHILTYSSHHTESICAGDQAVIQRFFQVIDASCVLSNASTRFNDGGELGLGAELGIATSKLHAYGPMGAKELTILRFEVTGNGQVRG